MNLKKLILIYFITCGFSLVPIAHAQEPNNVPGESGMEESSFQKRHGMMGKKIQEIYNQLNLTDEQKKLLQENKAKNREQIKATFEKMRSLRDALNQELMKPELDMNKVNEIQGQLKGLQSQMADNRLSSILEVRKILSAEQFTKFISLMEKHKSDRLRGFQGMEVQSGEGPDGPEEK